MKMHFKLNDFKFKDKGVLIRVDFNLPLDKNGRIKDDERVRLILPTFRHILKQKPKQIIVLTHVGRPNGKKIKALTTKKIAIRLSKLLRKPVKYSPDFTTLKKAKAQIIMFENLRFWKRERKNNPKFAKKLASLGDVYVNDAFANCHRDHASMTGIPRYLSSCSGFLVEKELDYITNALRKPKHPFIAIIGGIKLETKIPVIKNLAKVADKILVGSAIAFELNKKKEKPKKVAFPKDFVDNCDIGPCTIKDYKDKIKKAKTIVWNGPLGKFEEKKYLKGTKEVAKALAKSKAVTIVGGGDLSAALHKLRLQKKMTHISSGGGAFLELASGKKLAAVVALEKSYKKFKSVT